MLSKSLFRTSRIHLCTKIILQWLGQYTGPDLFSIGSNTLLFDFKKYRSCLLVNVERKYVGSFDI